MDNTRENNRRIVKFLKICNLFSDVVLPKVLRETNSDGISRVVSMDDAGALYIHLLSFKISGHPHNSDNNMLIKLTQYSISDDWKIMLPSSFHHSWVNTYTEYYHLIIKHYLKQISCYFGDPHVATVIHSYIPLII